MIGVLLRGGNRTKARAEKRPVKTNGEGGIYTPVRMASEETNLGKHLDVLLLASRILRKYISVI